MFIISDFKLDVESPYDKPSVEALRELPVSLPYPQNYPKYRFYGNNLKRMIDVAIGWEDGEKKDGLVLTIANHMKKCFLNWNKDTVEDDVIFNHLFELSEGKLNLKDSDQALTNSSTLLKTKNRFSDTKATTNTYKKHNNNNRGRKRY